VDTSAYVKLPLGEPEADALRAELQQWDGAVSSALLAVEAVRACARYGPAYAEQARMGLPTVALLPLDDDVLAAAAALEPSSLRSLDALHLATALSVREDVGAVLAYDGRLLEAAASAGLATASPGRG
jgi:predicted nucleic acid-binding protein